MISIILQRMAGTLESFYHKIFKIFGQPMLLQLAQYTHTYTRKKIKGKAVPLQTWSGPEGSRKLRFPDFMTMTQDGGKVVSLTHRPPLPPGNTPGTHFC